jgi:hypothetical protein
MSPPRLFAENARGTWHLARFGIGEPGLCGHCLSGNGILQTGSAAGRRFEIPSSAHDLGLMVDRSSILPFCVIIGECGAFHKGVRVRLGEASQ